MIATYRLSSVGGFCRFMGKFVVNVDSVAIFLKKTLAERVNAVEEYKTLPKRLST